MKWIWEGKGLRGPRERFQSPIRGRETLSRGDPELQFQENRRAFLEALKRKGRKLMSFLPFLYGKNGFKG
jgi:hypothetical protein